MCLAELTVYFESNFTEAAQRKTAKYMDLLQQASSGGYKAELLTLQMGSRGVPHYDGFQQLAETLSMGSRDLTNLLKSRAAIAVRLGSGAPGIRKPNEHFFPLPLSSFFPLPYLVYVCVWWSQEIVRWFLYIIVAR